MIRLYFLLASVLAVTAIHAQSFTCPYDVTLSIVEAILQENYGEVLLEAENMYVDEQLFIEFLCEGDTMGIIDKQFTIYQSAEVLDTCSQQIVILNSGDFSQLFPADTTIQEASYADLHPANLDVTLASALTGTLLSWKDDVILEGDGATIRRNWAFSHPCLLSGEEHLQIIKVIDFSPGGGITTGDHIPVNINEVNAYVNGQLYTCEGDLLTDVVNCICSDETISEEDIRLEIIKNDNMLDGISTLDIVLLIRQILGLSQLEKQYLLAGDVNNNGTLTAADALIMRKLILGIIPSFPDVNSWQFYKGEILDSAATDANGFDLVYHKEELCMDELNILAVKMGDLNGTATTSRNKKKTLSWRYQKNDASPYQIQVYSDQPHSLLTLQGALEITGNRIMSIFSDQLDFTHENFHLNNGNHAYISWNAISPLEINKDRPVLTLSMEHPVSEDIQLSWVNSKEEIYLSLDQQGELSLQPVKNHQLAPKVWFDGEMIRVSHYDKDFMVDVYTLEGQNIYHNENEKQIDASHLIPGIYLIGITAPEGKVWREKLLIMP